MKIFDYFLLDYNNDLINNYCSWDIGIHLDGNFRNQGTIRSINTSNNCCIFIGHTQLPFNWETSYTIIKDCKLGWIYGKNITQNKEIHLVNSHGNVTGLNASKNDIIVFLGACEL